MCYFGCVIVLGPQDAREVPLVLNFQTLLAIKNYDFTMLSYSSWLQGQRWPKLPFEPLL